MARYLIAFALAGCAADASPSGTSSDGVDGSTTEAGSTTSSTSIGSSTTPDLDTSSDDDGSVPLPDIPHVVRFFEIQPIFTAHCVAGCHAPGGEFPELDLGTAARSNLVLVASQGSSLLYVYAGDHEVSYLWHKVNGTHGQVGGMGSRMPANADPLPQEDIDLIATWIDDGAQP